MDCRVAMLQSEALLPRCAKFEISNDCQKKALIEQIKKLVIDCKDQDHICLLGLNELETPKDYEEAQEKFGLFGQSPLSMTKANNNNDSNYSIEEFHERVLRCITEMFYKEKFKYVSFLPGGFD